MPKWSALFTRHSGTENVTAGEVERITVMLLDALRGSGYVNPRRTASTEEKVRRSSEKILICLSILILIRNPPF